MADTTRLGLPLLAPSQAQKHVTVNEALVRLDGAVQLSVLTRVLTAPPGTAGEGAAYLVPDLATGAWAGQGGNVALWSNGGWCFLVPGAGWRAFVADERETLLHDGQDWIAGAVAVSAGGAALAFRVFGFDHAVTAGASSVTLPVLPGNAVVFGVTGRVIADLTGTLGTWRLGVAGADDRYGSGIGTGAGAWLRGLTGTPLTYFAPTELVMTAEGGSFGGGGIVRFAVHHAVLSLPREA